MPGLNNNIPPGDPVVALSRRVAALEALVKQLAAAPTLGNSSISQGSLNIVGGSISVAGGSFTLYDSTGTVLLQVGPQLYGDRGVTAYRADGSVVFRIAKIFSASDTQQTFQIYDRSGRVVGGDAQLSPAGFDSPHVPLAWRPLDRSDAKSTTSATFVSLFESRGIYNNPAVPYTFSVLCSDSSTAGQIQVIDASTGNPLAPFFAAPWLGTIPAGSTAETFITTPPLAVPLGSGGAFTVQVQVKRTAGTGSISLAVAQAVGGGF